MEFERMHPFHILFMPVINLVNVPKDNLIFALHVVGYTLFLHPAYVALQVPENTSTVTM